MIKGPRGVGKTTMMLQRCKHNGDKGLYASLDQLYFNDHTIVELADYHYKHGGTHLYDRKYLFEVGGKGKGFSQIADKPDSYVLVDNIETGIGNKIPIWLLGFLY